MNKRILFLMALFFAFKTGAHSQEKSLVLYQDSFHYQNKQKTFATESPFALKKSIMWHPTYHLLRGILLAGGLKLGYQAISSNSFDPIKTAFSTSVPFANLGKLGKTGYVLTVTNTIHLLALNNLLLNPALFFPHEIAYNVLSDRKQPHIAWSDATDIFSTIFSRKFWKAPAPILKAIVSHPLCLIKSAYNNPSTLGWLALGAGVSMGIEQLIFSSKLMAQKNKIKQLAKDTEFVGATEQIKNAHPTLSNITNQDVAEVYSKPKNGLKTCDWPQSESALFLGSQPQLTKENLVLLKDLGFNLFAQPSSEDIKTRKKNLKLLGFDETENPSLQDLVTLSRDIEQGSSPSRLDRLTAVSYLINTHPAAIRNIFIQSLIQSVTQASITLPGGAKDQANESIFLQKTLPNKAKTQLEQELPGLLSQTAQEILERIEPFWNEQTSGVEKISTLRRLLFILDEATKNHIIDTLTNNQKVCTCHICQKEKICLSKHDVANSESMNYERALELLNFSENTQPTKQEINTAFKKIAMHNHPDRFSTEEDKAQANKNFEKIKSAKEYLLNNLPNKKAQQTPQPDRLTKDRTQYFLVAKDKLKMFDMSPMCLDCWVELCAHYSNAVNSWDPEQQGKTEVDDQKIDANINKYRSQG